MRAEVDRTTLERGDSLAISIRVANTGPEPVEYWNSGQRYDLWIEDGTGIVWLWSQVLEDQGERFQDFLRREILRPGEEKLAEEVWARATCEPNHALESGVYRLRALWVAGEAEGDPRSAWWSAPVEFTIA